MIALNVFLGACLFFSSYGFVIAIIRSNTYEKYIERGKIQLSFDTLLDTSLAVCAAKCNQMEVNCAAVNYNAIEKQCELIAQSPTTIGSEFVEHHDNWNVYYIKNEELPPCIPSYTELTATESSNVITSPNYPNAYNNLDNVYWLIVKPSESSKLVMEFHDMELENHAECGYDSVSFYRGRCTDDELITRVCGTGTPTVEESSSLYVLVYLFTDTYVQKTGFSLEYFIDNDGSE